MHTHKQNTQLRMYSYFSNIKKKIKINSLPEDYTLTDVIYTLIWTTSENIYTCTCRSCRCKQHLLRQSADILGCR